jgi:hypothetical protein
LFEKINGKWTLKDYLYEWATWLVNSLL